MLNKIFHELFGRDWFREDYIAKMMKKDDFTWKNHEKYLYYSYKNKNYILPSILIFMFCSLGGWLGIMQYCGSWLPLMYLICHSNNRALDKDVNVIIERLQCMQHRIDKGEYVA